MGCRIILYGIVLPCTAGSFCLQLGFWKMWGLQGALGFGELYLEAEILKPAATSAG